MTRAVTPLRALLPLLLVGLAAPVPAPVPAPPAPQVPRNVVMIVADDHGQDLGAYGNPVIRTPNIDRLAEEGTLFRHAFATTASCSPSRSVILSGLHNHRNGMYGLEHAVHHFRSQDDVRGLPVLLAAAGYRTARIGKYHVAPESAYRFGTVIAARSERSPVEMAEAVRAFVSAERGRPFFLYFATSDPHRGGDPAVGQTAAGGAAPSPGRLAPDPFGNRAAGYPGVDAVRYRPRDVVVPPWLPDNDATRAELAEYYQSVSRVDQGVGRLVQVLKDAGVYDHTLVVYLSDHGAAFPGAKTSVYEPGLRAPLVVRRPDAARRGVRSEAMVSWVDLTPTVLDWAGVAPPTYRRVIEVPELAGQTPERHGLHGRSVLGVLDEERPAGWDEVYASHTLHEATMYYPMRVVRGRRWKLIWNLAHGLEFPMASDLWRSAAWRSVAGGGPGARYGVRTVGAFLRRPEWELYDLAADPWESRNLAADPRNARVLAEYKEKLREFQRRTSDPWLVKWIHE